MGCTSSFLVHGASPYRPARFPSPIRLSSTDGDIVGVDSVVMKEIMEHNADGLPGLRRRHQSLDRTCRLLAMVTSDPGVESHAVLLMRNTRRLSNDVILQYCLKARPIVLIRAALELCYSHPTAKAIPSEFIRALAGRKSVHCHRGPPMWRQRERSVDLNSNCS